MRALVPLLSAVALAASAGGAAAAEPACAGATAVASSCEFTFSGASLFFHAQNVRIVGRSTVLIDDTVTITVDNLTRDVRVASCTSTTLVAGCGATVNPGPRLAVGDLIRCTVSQWGAVTSVYNCS